MVLGYVDGIWADNALGMFHYHPSFSWPSVREQIEGRSDEQFEASLGENSEGRLQLFAISRLKVGVIGLFLCPE